LKSLFRLTIYLLCNPSWVAKQIYFNFRIGGVRNVLSKIKLFLKHQNFNYKLRNFYYEKKIIESGPLVSVVMPVFNTPIEMLIEAINSVNDQVYENWELLIVDDKSTNPKIKKLLNSYAQKNSRIKVYFKNKNEGISKAINFGLNLVAGDFFCILDHDDKIPLDALYHVGNLVLENPNVDYIYTDEDKISKDGKIHFGHFYKPDWSPEYFLGMMYTCHLSVFRLSIAKKIKGYRSQYDGAQDYDFALRFVAQINQNNIKHIPRILYHWRAWENSTAQNLASKPLAEIRGQKAVKDYLKRNKDKFKISRHKVPGHNQVTFLPKVNSLISIIIPTANKSLRIKNRIENHIDTLVDEILKKTTYKNYEIVVVHNGNLESKQLKLFSKIKNLNLVNYQSSKFSLSEKINIGGAKAKGDYLVLMNDDIRVTDPKWLEKMLGMQQRDKVGIVGVKLLFPDNTIQHAGVTLLNGYPGHPFYNMSEEEHGYGLSTQISRNYLAVTGACSMTPKWLFEKIGGYSKRYPINYNDVDYCLKLHQLGYRSVYLANVSMIHYEGVSKPGGKTVSNLEIKKFLEDWQYLYSHDPYYNVNLNQTAPYK